ncbi:MAG: hypothetical protein ACK2U1_00815 [Anaerolineales bacterium]|jgi:hypothetical protein
MSEEFGEPIKQEQGGAKRNVLLIIVVILILLCCCCLAGLLGLYYGTEPAMEFLGIPIPW